MKWLLTLQFFLFSFYSFSQESITTTACNISPVQCSYDLRSPIPAFMGQTTNSGVGMRCYARGCKNDPVTPPGANFHDVTYAAGNGTIGCPGATADCSQQDGSVLQYIAYYPLASAIGSDFETCKLPVVIFFHGGSFADCNGAYDAPPIAEIGKNFAERGFIFISVEYRTGVKVEGDGTTFYTAQQMLAIWRACQDARGAVRTIIKRELPTTAPAQRETEFHIDVNNIFLAGNSAGSVIAMNLAYYTDPMVISSFPPGIDNVNVLGNINQNYYVGGDGTGTNGINFTVKGVLDLWGGIALPNPYTVSNASSFFFNSSHTLPPTIAFCGKRDPIFLPDSRVLKFNAYLSENYCLNDLSGSTFFQVTPFGTNQFTYGNILGSQTIYEMLQDRGVLTEFYEDCDMYHGLDADCGGCMFNSARNPRNDTKPGCLSCTPFMSNFGTNNYTVSSVNYYIVQRAATFFQAVMNGVKPDPQRKHTSKFVECENYRYGCSLADNNNNCPKDNLPNSQVCTNP